MKNCSRQERSIDAGKHQWHRTDSPGRAAGIPRSWSEWSELQDMLGMRRASALANRARTSVLEGRTIARHDSDDEREAMAASERPADALTVPASVNVRRPGGAFSDPRLIGARAYAIGKDVVLADDVDVASIEGHRILRHELVHVAQANLRGDSTVRRYAGNIETQSVGPDYARHLTETELEEDLAFLEQHRARLKPDSVDYEVATGNMTVLGEDADRRRYQSPTLTRGPLIELFNSVLSDFKRVLPLVPQLKAQFQSVTWVMPWRPDSKAWSHDPMDFIIDQFGWMVDALSSAGH